MRGRYRSDRGSFSIMIAVLAVTFLSLSLLVVDGGRRLSNVAHAQDVASETARYAAQILDPQSVASGDPIIDASSVGQASTWSSAQGATGVQVMVAPDGRSVTVTLTMPGPAPLIPGFSMTSTATHTAFVLDRAPAS